MKRLFLILIATVAICCLMVGCGTSSQGNGEFAEENIEVKYAAGFRLSQGDGYRRIDVVDPWDTTRLL